LLALIIVDFDWLVVVFVLLVDWTLVLDELADWLDFCLAATEDDSDSGSEEVDSSLLLSVERQDEFIFSYRWIAEQ